MKLMLIVSFMTMTVTTCVYLQSKNVSANNTEKIMKIGNTTIPYANRGMINGQKFIDDNKGSIATWGGATTQSGTDNKNTHFIGHNPGIFKVLFSVKINDEIIVKDTYTETSYIVAEIFTVDDYGVSMADNVNHYKTITEAGDDERITLQTCINKDVNLIVIATSK